MIDTDDNENGRSFKEKCASSIKHNIFVLL